MTKSPDPRPRIVSREAWGLLREAKALLQDPTSTTEEFRLRWLAKHSSFSARHKPAAQKYEADFHARAAGIPCGVHITYYYSGSPATQWEPAEPPEVELYLLHNSGSRNHWLESRTTESEWESLRAAAIEHIKSSSEEIKTERAIEALINRHNT